MQKQFQKNLQIMEENAKPMKEMNVQEVKEFIEKEFESGVSEMFEGTAEFNTPYQGFLYP